MCLSAVGTGARQSEHVVVGGSVDEKLVVTVVGTGERHHTAIGRRELRVQTCHVGNAVGDGRHVVDLLRVHALSRAGLSGVESGTAGNDHLLELARVGLQGARDVLSLTEPEAYVIEHFWLITNIGNLDFVRTADTHTLYGVSSVDIGNGTVNGTGGLVGGGNGSSDYRLAVAGYQSGDAGRCYLCHGC